MRNIHVALATLTILLGAGTAHAQGGTITSGAASFTFNDYGDRTLDSAADVDLDLGDGDDHFFAVGFFHRVGGATEETLFPVPTTESYVGDTATLSWTDFDGTGLDATATVTLTQAGGATSVSVSFTIANPAAAPATLSFFAYLDPDLDDTVGGDAATGSGSTVTVTDVSTFTITADTTVLQAAEFPAIEDLLFDAALTTLDGSGLPFAAGDFSMAYQWDLTVPASGSVTQTFGASAPTPPLTDGGVAGDGGLMTTDGGLTAPDGGLTMADGGLPMSDGGLTMADAGVAGDGGTTGGDAGMMMMGSDAGMMMTGSDAGPPPPGLDAGPPLSGADAGPGARDDGGCSCRVGRRRALPLAPLGLLLGIGLLLGRRRRSA